MEEHTDQTYQVRHRATTTEATHNQVHGLGDHVLDVQIMHKGYHHIGCAVSDVTGNAHPGAPGHFIWGIRDHPCWKAEVTTQAIHSLVH